MIIQIKGNCVRLSLSADYRHFIVQVLVYRTRISGDSSPDTVNFIIKSFYRRLKNVHQTRRKWIFRVLKFCLCLGSHIWTVSSRIYSSSSQVHRLGNFLFFINLMFPLRFLKYQILCKLLFVVETRCGKFESIKVSNLFVNKNMQ
jgi:hypothetical protein